MSINLRLTDEQTEQIRAQADAEHRSMQSVVVAAIDEYIGRHQHKAKVRASIGNLLETESGVLKRLGEI